MRKSPNFKICGLSTPFSKRIPNRFFSKSPEVLTEGSGTKPEGWWGFRFLIKCRKLRGGVLCTVFQLYLGCHMAAPVGTKICIMGRFSIRPSKDWLAGSEAWVAGSDSWLAGSKAWLAYWEAWLTGWDTWPAGWEAWLALRPGWGWEA